MGVAILRLMRPKQWTKNFLVFAALLFAIRFREPASVQAALLCFAAMCLASSSVYVLNDVLDIERDRAHPVKRKRPLASGQLGLPVAVVVGIVCLAGGLGLAALLNRTTFVIVATYLVLQLAYNVRLKHLPIADVFTISVGFVLRAAVGAAAIVALISPWLLFCTGALALQLGFSKRRHELILQGDRVEESRATLKAYSRASLDALVVMSACGAALFYGIYSILSDTARTHPGLFVTSLFVFYGVSRYVFLAFSNDEGGEPETLLFTDPHMVFSVLGFLLTAVLALLGLRIPILDGYQKL
ncbi:MAG: UbiA prenyltransferase family protein [Fimbriimonadaceae bacterium]|nr:UbiA prenyltransferase family protein [Fimbriimonadaceae bacterium]